MRKQNILHQNITKHKYRPKENNGHKCKDGRLQRQQVGVEWSSDSSRALERNVNMKKGNRRAKKKTK